jgi:hypothetical protein
VKLGLSTTEKHSLRVLKSRVIRRCLDKTAWQKDLILVLLRFSLLHTYSWAYPAPSTVRTAVLKQPGHEVDHHVHLVQGTRMSAAVHTHLLTLCTFMAWTGTALPLPDIIRVISTKEHDVGGYFRGSTDLFSHNYLPSQQWMLSVWVWHPSVC